MKGIILHGGHGTRLRPLTQTGPKQLLPVANKPISQYALEDLRDAGIKDIAIVVGDLYPEKVKEYYGDGKKFGVDITYIHQERPLGIAHAVSLCKDFIGNQPFVVYLGDNMLKGGISDFVKSFENSELESLILLCRVKNPQQFGVAKLNSKGKLTGLVEKPNRPPSEYALTGIYFFRPRIFGIIEKLRPSWRGELEITEAIQLLMENEGKVDYRFVKGWWKDTGTCEDILHANRLVLDEMKPEIWGRVEDRRSISGKVKIEKRAIIKKGARVLGPSIVGEGVIIEKGAIVGPYASIGNESVLKGGIIENSIIMEHCVINVKKKIINSIIGRYSEIILSKKRRDMNFIVGERSNIKL
ncbi:MAG: glucose-1-phosphate thymidylyltransferase [Candidatus Hadarchaeum sp.]